MLSPGFSHTFPVSSILLDVEAGDVMSKQSIFWDWIASRYSKQPVADEASYRQKLAKTREYLTPESKVLEFGCGTGSTAIAHAPFVSYVLATDISANMVAIGREQADSAGLENIEFSQSSLLEIENVDAQWDVILGLNVLHLLDDCEREIQRAFELLKPGGVFITSTPCIADMPGVFKLIAPVFKWIPFMPNLYPFSLDSLKSCLRRAGFEIEYEWRPGPDKAVFIVARK